MNRSRLPARISLVGFAPDDRRWLNRLFGPMQFTLRSYDSAAQLLADLNAPCPGCVISQTLLPDSTGLRLLASVLSQRPDQKVILMADEVDIYTAVNAMKYGAFDFLLKSIRDMELIECVQDALQASLQAYETSLRHESIRGRIASLSGRESEVLELVVSGLANKQIAYQLNLSCKTVEGHRARVMDKMQAGSLAELVRMSMSVRSQPIAA